MTAQDQHYTTSKNVEKLCKSAKSCSLISPIDEP